MLITFCHSCNRGDQVVAFKTCGIDSRNSHCGKNFFNDVHLLIQDVRLGLALRFVFRCGHMTEGWFLTIKDNNNTIGLLLLQQTEQHCAETVNRIRHLTASRSHIGGQGKECAVSQRVTI